MAEDKKPQAVWEPGTLDATRKNIGEIDAEEAARMMKVLGGEVLQEKSVPIDYSKLPKRTSSHRNVRPSGQVNAPSSSSSQNKDSEGGKEEKVSKAQNLPSISIKDNQKIDRLMMSPQYAIKPNYGLFNFIKYFSKAGSERVIPEFVEITLKAHLTHLENFITVIKGFSQIAPDFYKAKMQTELDLRFRIIRKVNEWSTRNLKIAFTNLETLKDDPVVADLTQFVKLIYKPLITLFYLTEPVVSKSIKEIYTDLLRNQNVDKAKLEILAKNGVAEWQYLYRKVIRGLYPLLMRMCGTPYVEFPLFFSSQAAAVLNFLGMQKMDLVLQGKKQDGDGASKSSQSENKSEKEQKKESESKEENTNSEKLKAGLVLLDRLFPEAGFKKLESAPDMWPYFDPLYDFDEAFQMLSPENPMQITIVLCEIIQDFLYACNKMKFIVEQNPALKNNDDTITKALNEWPVYVDTLFKKDYGTPLMQLVNQIYSQPNYASSHIGKKTITEIRWQTKYTFLPYFSFEQLLLERPLNNNKYVPLSLRISFLKNAFDDLTKQISLVEGAKRGVAGLENPWDHYEFELESPISKRIDVFLNAKERGAKMTATNANLIKYISCIFAVIDWWVNDKASPAYKMDSKKIYRTRPGTDEPAFSVEAREDQDKLFAAAIRASMQKKDAQ